MKKSILFGALAVSLTTAAGYGQSVEELLGLSVSSIQTPAPPVGTGHATAEESPFYLRFAVSPILEGTINTNASVAPAGTKFSDSKIEFDLGIGVGASFGFRIPDTYFFVEVSTGFQWAGVKNFQAQYEPAGAGQLYDLEGTAGNLYQVPVLFTPGLEFELPGGFPFLAGGQFRFGPSIGVVYHDLAVNNIQGLGDDIFKFGSSTWVFAYGVNLALDLFLSHNIALSLGYQFIGTVGVDYGKLTPVGGSVALAPDVLPDVEANFTYTNVISIGIGIYF